jgi:hypothetical protein
MKYLHLIIFFLLFSSRSHADVWYVGGKIDYAKIQATVTTPQGQKTTNGTSPSATYQKPPLGSIQARPFRSMYARQMAFGVSASIYGLRRPILSRTGNTIKAKALGTYRSI